MRKLSQIDWRIVVQIGLGVAAGIVAAVGTLAVAVTSFSLSFDAITAVAKAAHVRGSLAWMMPVTVDGAMSVATVTAVVMNRLERSAVYPWIVVVAGALISIAANAAHAVSKVDASGAVTIDLNWASRMAISAIPAVMLALSVHLLVTLIQAFFEMASRAHRSEPGTLTVDVSETVTVNPPSASRVSQPGLHPALPAPPGGQPPPGLTSEARGELLPPPPVKPSVKPQPRRKTSPKGRSRKVNLGSLSDADLLQLFRDDFGVDGPPSANQVRVRYGIGASFAGEAFARWKILTGEGRGEVSGEAAQ